MAPFGNSRGDPPDNLIRPTIPIIADYSPHYAGQVEAALRARAARPADAEGRAKPDRARAGVPFDGFLGTAQVLLDEAGRVEAIEGMGVAVVADEVPGLVNGAGNLRAARSTLAPH